MAREDDEIRRRLEALNRKPLEPTEAAPDGTGREDLRRRLRRNLSSRRGRAAPGTPAGPIAFRRAPPRPGGAAPARLPPATRHVDLAEAVAGAEAVGSDGARVWLVERRFDDPEGKWAALAGALAAALADRSSGLWRQLRHAGLEADLAGEDLLFLDLETTGLGSSPLFLIGTMVWQPSGLLVRQYFARDYSEERAAVGLFLDQARPRGLLVSFNGKTFDVPYLRTRAAATGLAFEIDSAHLDLLHAARRVWKDVLPDCKLQTLERRICGRARRGDIPGHLIPEAYHAFVRTGNAVHMVDVLKHNLLDLLTLAEIAVRMPPLE